MLHRSGDFWGSMGIHLSSLLQDDIGTIISVPFPQIFCVLFARTEAWGVLGYVFLRRYMLAGVREVLIKHVFVCHSHLGSSGWFGQRLELPTCTDNMPKLRYPSCGKKLLQDLVG